MPGRRDKLGDLLDMTITDYVDSLVGQIEGAGLKDIVLAGHFNRLDDAGSGQLPRSGPSPRDDLCRRVLRCRKAHPLPTARLLIRKTARSRARKNVPGPTPALTARFVFMNGIPSHRRRFMTGKLYAESVRILTEPVTRRGMPADIPRTWILTRRDRALTPKLQRKYIEAIGGVQQLIEMDTCHMLMVSEPERLAKILVARCRSYT